MIPARSRPAAQVFDEGNLDEVGACLAAIAAMSDRSDAISREGARAIYVLTCIALAEWRKLDAAQLAEVGR